MNLHSLYNFFDHLKSTGMAFMCYGFCKPIPGVTLQYPHPVSDRPYWLGYSCLPVAPLYLGLFMAIKGVAVGPVAGTFEA